MNSSTHLISRLPETTHKIMDFLPTPDLESASLVNSTWEQQTLLHLLVRNSVSVHLHNVHDSMHLLPFRNLSPKQLNVAVHAPEENAEILLSRIELFTAIKFNTVTKLSLIFPLDNSSRHVAARLVKIYESFKNLKSLEFHPFVYLSNAAFSSDQDWTDLLPDSLHVPQKLTTLTVAMSKLYPDERAGRWSHLYSLTTRFLFIFRCVQNLKLIDTPAMLIQGADLILPHLNSISFLSTYHISTNPMRFITSEFPLKQNFSNVTRLEFNIKLNDTTRKCEILNLLAPQLEHLCISAVQNTGPANNFHISRSITVPIMPRLKTFEILRVPGLICSYETNWFRPYLFLQFETGEDEVKLVYAKQFPVLERLIVRVVREPILWKRRKIEPRPEENLHFEATMLLLYETFLAEGVAPCETLSNLDISFPPETWDVSGMIMKRRVGRDDELSRWGWKEEVPDFYARISKIFPHVDYHVVGKGMMDVKMAKFKKFKEMGVTLGIFDEEGIVYEDFSEMWNMAKFQSKMLLTKVNFA
ncbi:uncharacterized protein LOC118438657 [Folsomia candida]|uniref:uncharacterized protein LOC118438657 n=1 Tax=Folsomia candida TaxID=158441 RepID=UPI001605266F|nr:uncharacterized protein LOC118438657 [Folsomia candida]